MNQAVCRQHFTGQALGAASVVADPPTGFFNKKKSGGHIVYLNILLPVTVQLAAGHITEFQSRRGRPS